MTTPLDDGRYHLEEATRLNTLADEADVRMKRAALVIADVIDALGIERVTQSDIDTYHDARLDYAGRVNDAWEYCKRRSAWYAPEPGEPGGPQEPSDNPDDDEERKERE